MRQRVRLQRDRHAPQPSSIHDTREEGLQLSQRAPEQASPPPATSLAPSPGAGFDFGAIATGSKEQRAQMAADILQRTHLHIRSTNPRGDLPVQRADLGGRIRAAQGGGDALDGGVRRRLEAGLGADLSGVRVHADADADALSRSVQAVAFTTGRDIFFRSGAYQPSSASGMQLLAHEATHTVQQAAGPVAGTPTAEGVSISDPGDRFERAAEASADRVAPGLQREVAGSGGSTRGSFERVEAGMPKETQQPVVQRLIAIGDQLYYDDATVDLPQDRKPEWKANLQRITGKLAANTTVAKLLTDKRSPAVTSETLVSAVAQKLHNPSLIFNYFRDAEFVNFYENLTYGLGENVTKVLLPQDLLDEEDDLAREYDLKKGCVLQSLVNIGVTNPGLAGGQQTNVASWHNYYYVRNHRRYDDDAEMYKIYQELGLALIMNRPTLWKDLDKSLFVRGGSYVFSTPGHNFGVIFTDNQEFQPVDKPQEVITGYTPGKLIKYVWHKAG